MRSATTPLAIHAQATSPGLATTVSCWRTTTCSACAARLSMPTINSKPPSVCGRQASPIPVARTFVGRGAEVRSYVPLVAELFQTGRRWLDETTNAPEHFDPAQIMSMRMDGEGFGNIQRRIEYTKRSGNWLVLAGHEVREPDHERRGGTSALMLRELLTYAADPANGVWVAPVAEVAIYIQQHLPSARSH